MLTFGCSVTGTLTLTVILTGFCRNTSRCSSLQVEVAGSLKLFNVGARQPALSLPAQAAWIAIDTWAGSFGWVIIGPFDHLLFSWFLSFSSTCPSPLLTATSCPRSPSSAISRQPLTSLRSRRAFKGCRLSSKCHLLLLSSSSLKCLPFEIFNLGADEIQPTS